MIVKAIFNTANFHFEAYGKSEKEAETLLKKAWKRHSKDTGADPEYINEFKDDICFMTIEIGKVYRDNEEV